MEREPLRPVPRPQRLDRIEGHRHRRRYLGNQPPVRPPELQRPVRTARYLEALLVDRAVMPATEQREVVERRRAALGPVAQVMALAEAEPAAREAAAPVAVEQSAP